MTENALLARLQSLRIRLEAWESGLRERIRLEASKEIESMCEDLQSCRADVQICIDAIGVIEKDDQARASVEEMIQTLEKTLDDMDRQLQESTR